MESQDRMQEIVSLCKRRGFVFQSSEIYGGLKSAYDYGPLGVELKRNLMSEWWKTMVHSREDVVGLDSSIIMHPDVWRASGHLAGFSDPLVDCLVCKERFRADKAPRTAEGATVVLSFTDKGRAKTAQEWIKEQLGIALERDGKDLKGATAADRGYVCPNCNSPYLSKERQFNLMFRTSLGPVDAVGDLAEAIASGAFAGLSPKEVQAKMEDFMRPSTVYLRPETAQGMFVQFANVQQSMSMKLPFGIAQMGKSFRNEVTTKNFIFRSCEFEQMEMEFFCKPGEDDQWLDYWTKARIEWWRKFANQADDFRLRPHEPQELAHYAKGCFDIEYKFPWGFDELEGIANRTDYDLKKHESTSKTKLSYFDPESNQRFLPYVIEPAAGATRGVLAYLNDAFGEDEIPDAEGKPQKRTLLKLHPRLAPIKVAVLPLVKKDGLPELARGLVTRFRQEGINAQCDEQHAIGKRYRRHDEVGTPFCLTIDKQTTEDGSITIRDRDTTRQDRISQDEAVDLVRRKLAQ